MEHPLSGKMLADRERFREKTQSQDGMGRRSARKVQILIAESSRKAREDVSMICIFIEFSKISLSVHILPQIGRGGENKVCDWPMRYMEEVTWSADWGLSNFLQPGKSDAQPQTSGVFQVHHFTSFWAAALPSPRRVVPMLLSFSCFPVFHVLGFISFVKPESLGSVCYMRPADFVVKKCSFCT